MAKIALRASVVELAKVRVNALSEGKEKQAKECQNQIAKKKLFLSESLDSQTYIEAMNKQLQVLSANFNAEQIKTATRLEIWLTTASCEDEFSLFVLAGENGYIGHRIVKGY